MVSPDRESYFNFKTYVVHTQKKIFLHANLGLDGFTKPQLQYKVNFSFLLRILRTFLLVSASVFGRQFSREKWRTC